MNLTFCCMMSTRHGTCISVEGQELVAIARMDKNIVRLPIWRISNRHLAPRFIKLTGRLVEFHKGIILKSFKDYWG